ncbi:histidine kinase [Pontiellaceae bacterium B12227]|nr:histidine kinase [Pontiellaceae bacterium B12227]
MKHLAHILYLLLCIVYAHFSFGLFPEWNSNVIIPSIPLLAVGAWLFGTSGGLLIMLYLISIGFALSQVFGDQYIYFMDRATGTVIYFAITYLFGNLKKQYEAIRATNRLLDHRVAERDAQLLAQTKQLLDTAEKTRVDRGQELHDGVGQQLTGVQLLCSSLAYQLEHEGSAQSAIAYRLSITTGKAHNHIRRIARTLFPVRIAQVGLMSALTELAACFNEIRPAHILVKELSDTSSMPETTALQLYRICQESCTYFINQCNATQLEVTLNTSSKNYILRVAHNGTMPDKNMKTSILGLIQYRLKQINGKQIRPRTITERSVIFYEVPKKQLQGVA